MPFIRKDILSKILAVVDIWSYKVRVCVCSFKNNKITLLWYWEKRQWINCFTNGECEDMKLLTENIKTAMEKAELSAWKKVRKIVISFPFSELYFSSKKINLKRKDSIEPINKKELEKILEESEEIALRRTTQNIKQISWFKKEELKLIIWNIVKMDLDKNKEKVIIWKVWKNINISFLNIFIPISKYNLINYIWNAINKKIIKIIPTEYSIAKVFPQNDLVIVNIWANITYVTIKKDNEIIGVSKMLIWINDLVKIISKNVKDTKINIINNLNNNIYLKEKKEFIELWGNMLSIWIKEIVKNRICPSDFVILGWWKNNFIKDFFATSNPISKNVKLIKNIKLIKFRNKNIRNEIEDCETVTKKVSLDSVSLLLEINNLLNHEKTYISELLKKTITKLGF